MAYTTIDNPELYFQTKLYTGTGSSLAVTLDGSENLQPDWLWIKNRGTTDENVVHDSVRGVGKRLITDGTQAEATTTNQVSSFDSDGFTVPGGSANTGASSNNYVAWNWKAGGSASSNSNGSITSSVSASTTAGFSIVSWTGTGSSATVGHGLGKTPTHIIIKNRSDSVTWHNYSSSVITAGASNKSFLALNSSDALTSYSTNTTFTSVSSTTFGVGTENGINGSSDNMIAYCFADVKGYSKFGSYVGNGSSDGVFCFTGMKPSFVMIKRTDSSNEWLMFDNKRSDINVVDELLRANNSSAELTTDDYLDFTAQGFKIRRSAPDCNASGGSYIYMAFAENPFVTSTGVPACAR